MTKYVVWMRHGYYDINELTQRGISESERVGEHLKLFLENKEGIIFHSEENRTKQTAEIVSAKIGVKDAPLLETSLNTLINNMVSKTFPRLQEISEEKDFALIVTHQPDIEDLYYELGMKNVPEYVDRSSGMIVEYDTWKDVSIENIKDAKVIAHFTPRGIVPV